jgi:uncharacterized protein YgiM (DUF1202 family)
MARLLVVIAVLAMVGCSDKTSRPSPAIGNAYVGPITLNLRQEIHPKSGTVATVKHGEKVDIVQTRRRFVRVRTQDGQEGWTDSRQLLSNEQMAALTALAEYASKLESQGKATVYDALNVHTEPTRPSTSFYQLHEGVMVDVLGHKLTPRTNEAPKPAVLVQKPAPRVRAKKPKKEPKIPPPPKPAAPGLPENWRDLSQSTLPPEPEPDPPVSEKKVPNEDWTLVRLPNGKAGWALSRNLVMAIPDEVAQYSEGARITSYFALADVADGDQTKHHWLWTTTRRNGEPYQFDSFRVFTWVVRRHRYETAYIERGIVGYYPVHVERGATPKFALLIRDRDGELHRKTYILDGYLVRKVADELYQPPPGEELKSAPGVPGSELEDEEDDPTLSRRIKDLLNRVSW